VLRIGSVAQTGQQRSLFVFMVLSTLVRTVMAEPLKRSEASFISTKACHWSRVLLEKLTVTQLAKKFPAFYRARMFITVLARTRHWSVF
jgi:hypothetical protein